PPWRAWSFSHLVARADLRQVWGGGDFGALPLLIPSGSRPPVCVAWSLNSTSWVSADVWANVKVECEPSWQPFQGHCYRLQAEKRSWQESKKACLRGGGDLLSIHSMAELEFITKQIKQEVEELWIGLNDLKLQMNFEWSDGSLVSFTHWHPFEPNNFRDSLEDCVTIWGPVRTPSPQPPGVTLAEGGLLSASSCLHS
ncbi:C-type mannose receptor 2-like, partial [Ailuropoda melanoleuca]|uniref:C-type mannose receptor 2-like n=1 Tax=Ailuropoda melanoleuca TaxID=9646 RepID=UPI0014949AA0